MSKSELDKFLELQDEGEESILELLNPLVEDDGVDILDFINGNDPEVVKGCADSTITYHEKSIRLIYSHEILDKIFKGQRMEHELLSKIFKGQPHDL